jgi:hypothetical protein
MRRLLMAGLAFSVLGCGGNTVSTPSNPEPPPKPGDAKQHGGKDAGATTPVKGQGRKADPNKLPG